MRNFIRDVKENKVKILCFGEFWNPKEEDNNTYLEKTENRFDLVEFAFITIYMMPASKEQITI